ncbi:MAG: hypothetical protein GF309_12045, partial [Candidatus Lokiarchaeota archaeon]|nr:hypothetical protein [Candidatus Lokiarchaeota archaeon]
MNKRSHLVCLIALAILIAPLTQTDMELSTTQVENESNLDVPGDFPEDLNAKNDSEHADNVNLDMMHFTETPSSEGGLDYVCRRGVDPVAYFGKSTVKYLSGGTVFTLEFPGSNSVDPVGEKPIGSVTNYFLGSDSAQWRTGLSDYSMLRYPEIYPGIDLVYRIHDEHLKYDFVVYPRGNPKDIRLRYARADNLEIRKNRVTITRNGFQIADTDLQVFEKGKRNYEITSSFARLNENTVIFSLGSYDSSTTLIIDPLLLAYSTFLGGGSNDTAYDIAVEDGHSYITGITDSGDFPIHNAFASGIYDSDYEDCFVTKLTRDGQSISYSTYIGGYAEDRGEAIAVEDGQAYIIGRTGSADFPIINAYDSTKDGWDCFALKLSDSGQALRYSTYIGGSESDYGHDIAVENGHAFLTGRTKSSDFPTVNAYDSTGASWDCFVTKLAENGQSLVYSTYLGGGDIDYGYSIAVEGGYAYVTGETWSSNYPSLNSYSGNIECFVTKMSIDGQSLNSSIFIGGSNDDYGYDIAVEDSNAYVTGYTESSDFPTTNAYDATYDGTHWDSFVAKLADNGQSLVYSTYLGGSDSDYGYGIAVENGYAYITGYTESADFPTSNAYASNHAGGVIDSFVTKLSNDGQSLNFSTYLGGSNPEIGYAIEAEEDYAFITGYTVSPDFPVKNAYDPGHDCVGKDSFISVLVPERDSDSDGLYDGEERFQYGTNPNDADSDDDTLGDEEEIVVHGTNPNDADTDNDGSPDDWEINKGLNPLVDDASGDEDGDSLSNLEEYQEGTDPNDPDTDNDNLNDGLEVNIYCTNPNDSDSDNDGLGDGAEIDVHYTNALDSDTDCDGLEDGPEVNSYGTDPDLIDTDNDNFLDGYEITYGSNATDVNDYPAMPQEWYDEIYEDLDGNATLIQNLITWSEGNATLLENVKMQLEENATLLQQVISWLDGNHTAIENLYTYLEGNATLLTKTVDNLENNATLIQNLVTWSRGNETLLLNVIDQLESNATLLQQAISWLDGNHTAIENLYTYLEGNATLLTQTVDNLKSNATLIQNLVSWSQGNETLLLNVIDQLESNATLLQQTITWLDGNHTAIETLFTYMEGNATRLDQTIVALDGNATRLEQVAQWLDGNHTAIESLFDYVEGNATLLQQTVSWLETNHTAIENLYSYMEGNATLLEQTIQNLEGNATRLQQLSEWLDGNHTEIETLYNYLESNATLLEQTVSALNENATLIENLVLWSEGNATLLESVAQQLESNATLLQQTISWLDGNHTAIQALFTYVEGNATLLQDTVTALEGNATQLELVAALATDNHEWLQELNSTAIGNITEIREVLDQLGAAIGDADYDGLDDLDELEHGTDTQCIDTDCDNLNDAYEVKIGTDPLDDDTDQDGYFDGAEVLSGTDPLDAADYPGVTDSTTTTGPPSTTTGSQPPGGLPFIVVL